MPTHHRHVTALRACATVCTLVGVFAVPLASAREAAPKPAATPSWSALAKIDIDAIHDELKANHPAMVDTTPLGKRYQQWLEDGRTRALHDAESATTGADYARVLRRYVVGFEDGHIGVSFDGLPDAEWPGFFTREVAPGRIEVSAVGKDAPLPPGATLEQCDGRDARQLMDELVVPYRVNPGIPHQRGEMSTRLMLSFPDDTRRPTRCRFLVDGAPHDITLQWRKTGDDIGGIIERAAGTASAPLGMRTVDDVVFISAPSFHLFDKDADTMRAMLERIDKERETLQRAPWIVIDVRGNGGGNSNWGDQLASVLYGEPLAASIANSFDWSIDWRATPHNAQVMRDNAASQRKNGMTDVADGSDEIAKAIDAAVAAGEPYLHRPAATKPYEKPAKSPYAGKVFFLTDNICASACLDFADLMLRMPGVVHIGLPTSADAVYIDNYGFALPSGKARIGTSLKVYRNRVRGNNEWYTPQHAWTGGTMDDAAIAAWVKTL